MNNLSGLQKVQLDIFKEFIRICDLLDLRYFLVEGSMLGAKRHNGFIPWDDDIDVAMPRKDYEVFLKKANSKLFTPYHLTTYKDKEHYWMTAILWNTDVRVQLSNATETITKFAWIDIIPLDGMPDNSILQKIHYIHFYLYRALFQASYFSKIVNISRPRPWYEKICIKLFQKIKLEKLFNSNKIGNKMNVIMKTYNYDNSNNVVSFISDYKMKEIMPKAWYGKGKKIQFETIQANGVANADMYLKHLYGDYMIFPSAEKQKGKHNAIILN